MLFKSTGAGEIKKYGVVQFCFACFKQQLLLFVQSLMKLESIDAVKYIPALQIREKRMFQIAGPPHNFEISQPWPTTLISHLTDMREIINVLLTNNLELVVLIRFNCFGLGSYAVLYRLLYI